MAIEIFFRKEDDDGKVVEVEHELVEPYDYAPLYADYSTGERQMITVYGEEDGTGTVITYPSEGTLEPDGEPDVDEINLPDPISSVSIDRDRPHNQELQVAGQKLELVARFHPPDEILVFEDGLIIPRSLMHPDHSYPWKNATGPPNHD